MIINFVKMWFSVKSELVFLENLLILINITTWDGDTDVQVLILRVALYFICLKLACQMNIFGNIEI